MVLCACLIYNQLWVWVFLCMPLWCLSDCVSRSPLQSVEYRRFLQRPTRMEPEHVS